MLCNRCFATDIFATDVIATDVIAIDVIAIDVIASYVFASGARSNEPKPSVRPTSRQTQLSELKVGWGVALLAPSGLPGLIIICRAFCANIG